jgi:hypothetical protein
MQTRYWLLCLMAAVALLGFGRSESANAVVQFSKAWEKQYLGDKSTDVQKQLAKHVARVKKCNVCHDPRKDEKGKASKKNRNPYGTELSKLLTKKDKKNTEKILKALKDVEKKKLKDSEKTYGEMILAGQLPFEYKESK